MAQAKRDFELKKATYDTEVRFLRLRKWKQTLEKLKKQLICALRRLKMRNFEKTSFYMLPSASAQLDDPTRWTRQRQRPRWLTSCKRQKWTQGSRRRKCKWDFFHLMAILSSDKPRWKLWNVSSRSRSSSRRSRGRRRSWTVRCGKILQGQIF